jgi:hypothetical protein
VKFDVVKDKFKIVWNTLYGDDNLKGRQTNNDFYAQQFIPSTAGTTTPLYSIPNQTSNINKDSWFINHMSYIITPNSKLTVLLDWTFGQRKGETVNSAYGYYQPDVPLTGIGAGYSLRGDKRDTIKIYNTYGLWLKYQFNDWFATAVRYEHIDDSRYGGAFVVNAPNFANTPRDRYDLLFKDSVGLRAPSSRGQARTFTVTPTFTIDENMLIKIDLRRDWALDKTYIDEKGRAVAGQNGIIIGVVAKF